MNLPEGEILRAYRNAQSRRRMPTILAQLYACKREEIVRILERGGELNKPQPVCPKRQVWGYTEQEIDIVRQGYAQGLTADQIAAKLPFRDAKSVYSKARRLGLI